MSDFPKIDRSEKITEAYNLGELEDAFALVSDPKNWKGPIFGRIDPSEKDVVSDAVEFYTATKATFEPSPSGRLLVTAAGYAAGPAGDH